MVQYAADGSILSLEIYLLQKRGGLSEKKMDNRQSPDVSSLLSEMSELLGTGLNEKSVEIIGRLCDLGINPYVLSHVVSELRREKEAERR